MNEINENLTGRLYDIQGFSVHDGPGIRTTVYLKECPLRCLWCHSPESVSRDYELAWFDVKCIGIELCGKCLNACPAGALSAGAPEPVLAGAEGGTPENTEPRTITRVNIDREICTVCLACTRACSPKALAPSGYEMSVEAVFERVNRDRPFFGDDGGVTISGGEPMAQFDFTYALARRFKADGVSVCMDTTGFAPGKRYLDILPFVDLFLYDLKHMDSERSKKLTGVPNEMILENARLIAANGGRFQIRVPIIPKLNDSEENLRRTAEFAASLGDAVADMQLLPYHKLGSAKYARIGRQYPLTNVEPPPDKTMHEYLDLMLSYGLPAHIH
ncbi:MAG: glycyl-radical enzyme activating protein [Clostridiales Family XIII bacterium]|jgi:pyruvate formate lyase activating enzyme|nr:glycyl-radical enzyme activating protein [Clostridiales Family XIII bacterium]